MSQTIHSSRFYRFSFVLVSLCTGAFLLGAAAGKAEPNEKEAMAFWIWSPDVPDATVWAPAGDVFFRRSFELPRGAAVAEAILDLAVDNRAWVFINGERVGDFEGWNPLHRNEVSALLAPGTNTIVVRADNFTPSPAGLLLSLDIELEGPDRRVKVVSGPGWDTALEKPAGNWQRGEWESPTAPAGAFGKNGGAPWGLCLPPGGDRILSVFSAEGADISTLTDMLWRFHPASNIDIAGTYALAWLPRAMLWVGDASPVSDSPTRRRVANRIGNMLLSPEGYVSCHQHPGLGHSEGWPFPLPSQSQGFRFFFTLAGQPYGPEFGLHPVENVNEWRLWNAESLELNRNRGWKIRLAEANASIESPDFDVDAFVSPFIRVIWNASALPKGSDPHLSWILVKESGERIRGRMPFPRPSTASRFPVQDFDIPVHEITGTEGRVTRLRVEFGNPGPGEVTIQRIFAAVDSRHPINNPNYLIAATDYFRWTGDREWLLANLPKMRIALDYMLSEFAVRETGVIRRPWVGHDGRSGLEITPEGEKIIHYGVGIGGNYWDLMPFGGDDVIATTYLYAALTQMAAVEEYLADSAETRAGLPAAGLDAAALRDLAEQVREQFQATFWNEQTRRFAPIDDRRRFRDYGYTFVNNEAIFHGLASDEQAEKILGWLDGERMVEGDTSTGEDIYRWRFGPRSSTKRNIEYYQYVWSAPEHLPFGDQVQDGGAVLGFTYHDLMARIQHLGPDSAWRRLEEIMNWYRDIEEAGGERAYYAVPGRGTLQGGGTPGGLGIDEEFFESVMAPSVVLDGFLGFAPRPDGFELNPRLPTGVRSLRITNVAYRDLLFDVDFSGDEISFRVESGEVDRPLTVRLPEGSWDAEIVTGAGERTTLEPRAGREFVLPTGELNELRIARSRLAANLDAVISSECSSWALRWSD